jgi:hypothetical protein
MWNSSINAELMVKTDFYSKYIHIHNYNAKSRNFEKMRCKVRMRISYYKAFSSATVRFFPAQTINEDHNLSCYRPEPSPSALITSIRNTGCSIASFFPSILRFISNCWEANDVVIYSSKTLVTSSVFVSLDLCVYYWVVC